MSRLLKTSLITLLMGCAWIVSVFLAFEGGWFKTPAAPSDSVAAFLAATERTIAATHTGNFTMVLLENGEIAERYSMSAGAPVDTSSVFQVASLGKWLTAWGVMVLVEDGALDLDAPVSDYLTRWNLPESEFDESGVTVRRLLSHTAGLDDGLGYDGFETMDDVQTLEDSLSLARDASPSSTGVVKLGAEPGSAWMYSGGGYTMLQLIIEEVSGQSFAEFMSDRVFNPLGMSCSTFRYEEALQVGLADNFDLKSNTEPFRWYTALAATSLFTCADDLATFITAQSRTGAQTVLSKKALNLMQTPHASRMGADIWGLGLMLYAPNNRGGHIVGHDGNNAPAINTVARLDPTTGDGIVILSTGSHTLATETAGEWVFWKTGNIDNLLFLLSFNDMLIWMGMGSLAILILGGFAGWKLRQSRPNTRHTQELEPCEA